MERLANNRWLLGALRGIAAARPGTLAELSQVQGVGEAKLLRYGEAMLAAVAAYEESRDVSPA